MAMSFATWKNSRSKSVRLGRNHAQRESDLSHHKWLMFWKRIGKGKKKRSSPDSSLSLQMTYDPESYLQNFDEGSSGRVESDNLYRSFSARYADPSRLHTIIDFVDG